MYSVGFKISIFRIWSLRLFLSSFSYIFSPLVPILLVFKVKVNICSFSRFFCMKLSFSIAEISWGNTNPKLSVELSLWRQHHLLAVKTQYKSTSIPTRVMGINFIAFRFPSATCEIGF